MGESRHTPGGVYADAMLAALSDTHNARTAEDRTHD